MEFRYRNVVHKGDMIIAISQSGETADTLVAIERAKEQERNTGYCKCCWFLYRENISCRRIYTCRPELRSQHKSVYRAVNGTCDGGIKIAKERGTITNERYLHLINELNEVPEKVKQILDGADYIKDIAAKYKDVPNALYLDGDIISRLH